MVNKIIKHKDYAEIIMNNNKISALIDIEDIDKVKEYNWYYSKRRHIRSSLNGKSYYLHNLITGLKNINHINKLKHDNRKVNLRQCSVEMRNYLIGKKANNTSGCVGVYPTKTGKFHAKLKHNNLGTYDTFDEAVTVRKKAELEFMGENI